MLDELEKRIVSLLDLLSVLKRENSALREENERLVAERAQLGSRIDNILQRLEGL